jgi:hypothetical protein
MNPRLVEELARQRHAETIAQASRPRPARRDNNQGRRLRSNTGWAIVAIGLKIAESGSRS